MLDLVQSVADPNMTRMDVCVCVCPRTYKHGPSVCFCVFVPPPEAKLGENEGLHSRGAVFAAGDQATGVRKVERTKTPASALHVLYMPRKAIFVPLYSRRKGCFL